MSILEPFKIVFKKYYKLDFYRKDKKCPESGFSKGNMNISIKNSKKLKNSYNFNLSIG